MAKRYTVTIDMDNAAFADGNAAAELSRILSELSERVRLFSFVHPATSYLIKDVNGNTCGHHGYVMVGE